MVGHSTMQQIKKAGVELLLLHKHKAPMYAVDCGSIREANFSVT